MPACLHPLNLPPFDLKCTDRAGRRYIFDVLRRCYVVLTPEEWVRQHFVHYLIDRLGYPKGLLANERMVQLNGMRRRCDTVLFDRSLRARMIVEYKAPTVELTQAVFDQIYRYNIVLHADYLVVSNGLQHYCCSIDYEHATYRFLPHLPAYAEAFG